MSFLSPSSDLPPLPAPEPVPQLLRDLVHERTGVFFESDRYDIFLEKLLPRAREYGCSSFLDYYYILKYDEKGPAEWRRVMDAFSVQETYFWREFDQIEALVNRVVPAWFKDHAGPLRIWSAACATGEEPYSLAIALQEAGFGDHPIELLGSDASEAALERARTGIFRERSFRALPSALREKYFRPVSNGHQIDPQIAAKIRFRWANLVGSVEISDLAQSYAVFCRNVFIYFSPNAIKRTLASFAEQMPDKGHLFVGSSESLLKLTNDFELQEIDRAFVYVRKPRPKAL